MSDLARAARNLFLLTLVAIPLAACGDGSSAGTAAAATSADTAAVQAEPNVGVIDRSPAGSASTPITATTTPSTTPAPPASGDTITKTTTPPVTSINGVATLDWQPPTANTDGTALTNLAGYTIYYGTSADNLSQSVKVSNPGLTAYSVTGLPSGTWYFAVTSLSTDGVESARSTTVSTKI